jgi:lipoate-protein ligase A
LSIEHHLFQTSPPGSKVLFQYVNRPSIIIGRNQNPWLEVNLALLRDKIDTPNGPRNVDLVRRRSGGGTVFHDEGNVNWSVICDFTDFTRDRHAEMVVRALRSLGVKRARVNERHDIVLDQGAETLSGHNTNIDDTHTTPYTSPIRPLKVSGSAYKMARNRALHHGTALLNTPNLKLISKYLKSPARGYIEAKGVESVSSPVTNIGVENGEFMDAVRMFFVKQYDVPKDVEEVVVNNDALEVDSIRKGHTEMKNRSWMWEQTPGFTFSSEPLVDGKVDIKNVSALTFICDFVNSDHILQDKSRLTFEAKHGAILDCEWRAARASLVDLHVSQALKTRLEGAKIHEQRDWKPLMEGVVPEGEVEEIALLLAKMFPPPA